MKGPYVDVDGTPAIFEKFILNYWGNTDRGFPIVANYRWSFWAEDRAEIADGHNSLLRDDDGGMYLVYHRKFNNHTGWHNVETHQLFFNRMGWIVAAPFEYHEGYGLPARALDRSDIAGPYKVIMHNPPRNNPQTWEDSVAVNQEQNMQLNADGTVTSVAERYEQADAYVLGDEQGGEPSLLGLPCAENRSAAGCPLLRRQREGRWEKGL